MRSSKKQLDQQEKGPLFQVQSHYEKQEGNIELSQEFGLSSRDIQIVKKQLSRN